MKRDEDLEVIRHRLILARKAAGLSQADVACELLIHRPTLSIVESGQQRLTMELYLDLCRLYGVDPGVIMQDLDTGYTEMVEWREKLEILAEKRRGNRSRKQPEAVPAVAANNLHEPLDNTPLSE